MIKIGKLNDLNLVALTADQLVAYQMFLDTPSISASEAMVLDVPHLSQASH